MSNDIICPPIIGTKIRVNTSATSLGSVVGVSCAAGYELSGQSVLICTSDGYWNRLIPSCKEESYDGGAGSGGQITLIVICVIATAVALGVAVLALYMLLGRREKKQKTEAEEFEEKMKEIRSTDDSCSPTSRSTSTTDDPGGHELDADNLDKVFSY